MLVSLEWLQSYFDEVVTLGQVIEAMEKSGIEVESFKSPTILDDKIIAARVVEVKPHPNADKLSVAIVKDSVTEWQIVCGAPNLRTGQIVALAQSGSSLPDNEQISNTKIRGTESFGMLCSEVELELGGDNDGILILDDNISPGTPLNQIYQPKSAIIDITTAANRPDLQSYQGIARDIAAQLKIKLELNYDSNLKAKISQNKSLFINQAEADVESYGLVGLTLDNTRPTPLWIQQRLRDSGIRTINLVVDITNYVMLDSGQPLHAYDGIKTQGSLCIRLAKPNESIQTLDSVKRILTSEDLIITDTEKIVAIAGVMGSLDSEVTSSSTQILIEGGTFAASLVRKSAKRHNLRSEASSRFERGLPLQSVKLALRQATELLLEHASASLTAYQYQRHKWPWVQHIGFTADYVSSIAGMQINSATIIDCLKSINFEVFEYDIVTEAKSHLGKPYKFGANFKDDGVSAFDCSYLIDYLYSLIGVKVGHTALGQYELGREIAIDDLQPGDVVFYEGLIDKSAVDHYYTTNEDNTHTKHQLKTGKRVGHNGLYIGDDKVIMAATLVRDKSGNWVERSDSGVVEVNLSEFTASPDYLGARRYIENLAGYLAVTVPWWRSDVKTRADIVEEVIKLVGLDKIPSTLPTWKPESLRPDNHWTKIESIRQLFYGLGLFEVTTYPFISQADIDRYMLPPNNLKLKNPRSQEQAFLRNSLLVQIVNSVAKNTTLKDNFSLFEIAKVFNPQADSDLPEEKLKLAIASFNRNSLLIIKGFIDQLLGHINIEAKYESNNNYPWLHPSRQAEIIIGGKNVGNYGTIHPDITTELKLDTLSYVEIDLAELLSFHKTVKFVPMSKYQSGFRDLTIGVESNVLWQEIKETLNQINELNFSFGGEFFKDKQKYITIHLEFIAFQATLNDDDIDKRMSEVTSTLQTRHKATF